MKRYYPNNKTAMSLVVLLFIGCMIFMGFVFKSDDTDIRNWAEQRQESIKTLEYRTFYIGPYWSVKGQRHYYMETDKGIYWIRYGWGRSIKQEMPDHSYQILE